jgi:ATP-dependent exoDNAse (exonuclease V) beta subunit
MDFGLPKVLVDNSCSYWCQSQMIQKKQEELLDNVNVLYVALTRAESNCMSFQI